MDGSLRDKLLRLGVHKGASQLRPRVPPAAAPDIPLANNPRAAAVDELWNIEAHTMFGVVKILRTTFGVDHVHGDRRLIRSLEQPFRGVHAEHALYLDTETTGLAGGAGTLAFLIGVGYFDTGDDQRFIVDQYFLQEPADEAAMLAHLESRVHQHDALVTFNGRAFDVPLLETRYVMQRIPPSFSEKTHLDLLIPSRQVWRGALASCSLGSLEFHLLGVHRDQQDIAGFLIPQLYREYLQAGAPRRHEEMQRVMYHNLHDILSMVTLSSRLLDAFDRPQAVEEHIAVATQFERAGDLEQAIATYARALQSPDSHAPSRQPPRARMAANLKKLDRHGEAVEHWQMLAAEGDRHALIELAMFYEWREKDIEKALKCARRAHMLAGDARTRAVILSRVARLERKSPKA